MRGLMPASSNRRAWSRAFVLAGIYFAVVALLLAAGLQFSLTLLLITAAAVLLFSFVWRGLRRIVAGTRR